MQDLRIPRSDRLVEKIRSGSDGRAALRVRMVMVGLCAASACVDLTPPPEVVNYRNGLGKGGDHAGGDLILQVEHVVEGDERR